jgi:hypothetical protein
LQQPILTDFLPLIHPHTRLISASNSSTPAAATPRPWYCAQGLGGSCQPVRPLLRRQLHGQADAPRLHAQGHAAALWRDGRNHASGLRTTSRIDTTIQTVISVLPILDERISL